LNVRRTSVECCSVPGVEVKRVRPSVTL
jgi:hypothetical protein